VRHRTINNVGALTYFYFFLLKKRKKTIGVLIGKMRRRIEFPGPRRRAQCFFFQKFGLAHGKDPNATTLIINRPQRDNTATVEPLLPLPQLPRHPR
jgi:hypothetical protein